MRTFPLSRFRAFNTEPIYSCSIKNVTIRPGKTRVECIRFLKDAWFINAASPQESKNLLDELLLNGADPVDKIFIKDFEEYFVFKVEESPEYLKAKEEIDLYEKELEAAHRWVGALPAREKNFVNLLIQQNMPSCS